MSESRPQWVRLHLVPQTDYANSMPPFVTGLLMKETPSGYVLNPMLEPITGADDEDPKDAAYIPVGLNIILRPYVWRVQILSHKPEIGEAPVPAAIEDDGGGLG